MTERDIQLAILDEIRTAVVCAAPNYTPSKWWECDLWAVTRSGYATEYEIKLTLADFRADRGKARMAYDRTGGMGIWDRRIDNKHELCAIGDAFGPTRFFYVVPEEIREKVEPELPEWSGFAVAQMRRVSMYSRHERLCIRCVRPAKSLHKVKVARREITLCQRRMWFRYWESLRDIERMKRDRAHELAQVRGDTA